MSGVYWGIVAGLLAMVGTLFLCVDIMYSQSNKTPKAANGNVGESGEAMTQSPAGSRQAA
jgi:hypothetical protein